MRWNLIWRKLEDARWNTMYNLFIYCLQANSFHAHTHTQNSVILSSPEYLISKPTTLRVYLDWTPCRKGRLYMHVKDKGKAVLKHEIKTLKRTTLVLVILIRKNNKLFFLSSFLPSSHKYTQNMSQATSRTE